MKTKIVYVLISDLTDNYLEQAIISLYSLRLYNPSATVEMVVDDVTSKNLIDERAEILKYINKLHVIDCSAEMDKKQRSRHLKTSLRSIVDGDYLFIDTDTVIGGDLSDADKLKVDIGAVKDKHILLKDHPMKETINHWASIVEWDPKEDIYFNSGVFYVKDNAKTQEFYKKWNEEWHKSKNSGLNLDQPSLGKTNSQSNIKIQEIDGIWNCQITDNGLKYLYNGKIIHYFASMQPDDTVDEIPFYFRNPNVFKKLRDNKNQISPEFHNIIENAKSMFPEIITLSTGRNAELLNTKTYKAIRKLYFTRKRVFERLEWILKKVF